MKRFIWITPLALLILTQFNNCSPYAQTDNSELSSLGDLVCDTDCITPNINNLAVTPHLFNGATGTESANLQIAPNLGDFDIGGVCNEGGYAYNTIVWYLYDQTGNVVRDSNRAAANTQCVNGRFKAYVKLTPISSDNNDRTGLRLNGAANQSSYTLQLKIFGQLVQNGALQINTNATSGLNLIGVSQ